MSHLRVVLLPAVAMTGAVMLGACSNATADPAAAAPTATAESTADTAASSMTTAPAQPSPTKPSTTKPSTTKPSATAGAAPPDGTIKQAYLKSINTAGTSATVQLVSFSNSVAKRGKTYRIGLSTRTGYYTPYPEATSGVNDDCDDADFAGTCKITLKQVRQDLHDYKNELLVKVTVAGGTATRIAEYQQGG